MFKITCNDPSFFNGNEYRSVTFVGVGYTENEGIANEFKSLGYTKDGEPLFTVEEITE